MVKLGRLELGSVPRIAVPLSDIEVREQAETAKGLADVFELRIDHFQRHDAAYVAETCQAAAAHGVPLLATIRLPAEGGHAALSDPERLAIFRTVAPLVDALDTEFHSLLCRDVMAVARTHHKPVIVSYHDFRQTPPDRDLVNLIEAAKRARADIVKLAVTTQTFADVERLLAILHAHRDKNLIVIALGKLGMMSRVFFPLVGSLLTYGYLREANAPGQMSLIELNEEFRRYCPDFRR